MNKQADCDQCTKAEYFWVTLFNSTELCVTDLVEWGEVFRKYMTNHEECHQDQGPTHTVAYIVAAVGTVATVILGSAFFIIRKRRQERNRWSLIPYRRLGSDELADTESVVTDTSFNTDLESQPSTSAASRLSHQKTNTEVSHEPSVADMLELVDAVSTTPKSELKAEGNYEEARADAESGTGARSGAEIEAGATSGAFTGAKIGAGVKAKAQVKIEDTDGDTNEDYNDELFFDSSSECSLHGEETEVDEEFEAAAAAGKLMDFWKTEIKKE